MTATIEDQKTTNQQSWADLLESVSIPIPPRESLISRADLLAQLHPYGPDIPDMSEVSLIEWEKRGFLPRAVVQSHQGKVQATYPAWWTEVVRFAWHVTHAWGYSREAARNLVLLWIDSAGRKEAFTPIWASLEVVRLAVNALADDYRRQQMTRFDQIKGARLTFVDSAGQEIFETEFNLSGSNRSNLL